MNVSLTPELERMVDEKVKTGLYSSASEVVREALRLLHQFDEARQREIEELNRKIDLGLAQADRGEVLSGEESRRLTRARRAEASNRTT